MVWVCKSMSPHLKVGSIQVWRRSAVGAQPTRVNLNHDDGDREKALCKFTLISVDPKGISSKPIV